ncbi:hypothetical protein CEXT_151981 [Caerostris extrusa]|uniref:Uncharacterized protein n=1 Tax=Caerostris extrusa TaxID=172846 RepID=A0AAV4XDE4_CAEEX|nr:hypothetical protein CEXT_151981 [Caerostris extrusa]
MYTIRNPFNLSTTPSLARYLNFNNFPKLLTRVCLEYDDDSIGFSVTGFGGNKRDSINIYAPPPPHFSLDPLGPHSTLFIDKCIILWFAISVFIEDDFVEFE